MNEVVILGIRRDFLDGRTQWHTWREWKADLEPVKMYSIANFCDGLAYGRFEGNMKTHMKLLIE